MKYEERCRNVGDSRLRLGELIERLTELKKKHGSDVLVNTEAEVRRWYGDRPDAQQEIEACLKRYNGMREALAAGRPIVDERGELLPEFDYIKRS